MDPHKALRALVAALVVGLTLAFASGTAFAQNKDAAAKALQKKAMEEDYLSTDFAAAQTKLEKAIKDCGEKCAAPLRAALRRDLGVVLIGGQIDKKEGIEKFVEAMKIDPKIALDPDLKTKEMDAAWAEAKKKAGGGAGPGPAEPTGDQPQGDFAHTPAPEQQIRTPIPIYAEYAGEEPLVKVIARYKGFGMTDWKSIELKKMGDKGWGGMIPCPDVQQGIAQYYLQGFNAANDPVATGGDRNHPYKVAAKKDPVADPPHLPNEAAPKQCADTGDCPPNFPGCKKTDVKVEGPSGKEGGEYCEEDSECKSAKCNSNKCTEPTGPMKAPKIWVGLWGAIDYSFLPSADDVCKLKSTKENQEPVNDGNYYCTLSGSSDDYPYRLTGPGDTNPRAGENNNLQTGTSDKVSGGGAIGNIRIMASLDYAVNMNLMIGGRIGYVLLAYPGQAGKDDGKTFPPIHVELRGTYLIGPDALAQKFAPYVFAAGGVSTWDAVVGVQLVETANGVKTKKDVDAWHIGGPAFISLGGGIRLALTPKAAIMGGLRINAAFGNSFAPSAGPEVGIMIGF